VNRDLPIRYAVHHVTRFTYDSAVSESVMEVRTCPATSEWQRCLQYAIDTQPRARVFAYQDSLGNRVHYFTLPRRHTSLVITSRAEVEVMTPVPIPDRVPENAWLTLEEWHRSAAHWDFLQPSQFARPTDRLLAFVASLDELDQRRLDPLSTVRQVMSAIYSQFSYTPRSTRVDSPIDEALEARRGVCQDFSHIMIAVLRQLGIPARYVSGYLAPEARQPSSTETIATHAWVEACLPELGWIGVDPTHNVVAGPGHLRVAIGRDYADVPPTRGVFKGGAASTLAVSVEVSPAADAPAADPAVATASWQTNRSVEEAQAQQQ
jgi:transglutaminase-like putative cysteine protease